MKQNLTNLIGDYIAGLPPDLRAICKKLRAIARASMPGAHELLYRGAVGYSLTESPFDRVCCSAPQSSYVNLGFFAGKSLPDPRRLLVGEGARMRHIKIRGVDETGNPALARIVKAAWADAPVSIPKLHARRRKNP